MSIFSRGWYRNLENVYHCDMKLREIVMALMLVSPLGMIGGCHTDKTSSESSQNTSRQSTSCTRQLVLPDIPMMVRSETERELYLLDHYWDNVDFTEPGIEQDTLFVTRCLVSYLDLSREADEQHRRHSAWRLVQQSECNPAALRLLLSKLSSLLYDPASHWYDETLYLPFVEAAIASDSLSSSERDRLTFARKQISKNYPGTQATDFSYMDTGGQEHRLSALYDTVPVLIFFFRPDCSGCDVMVQQMRQSAMLDQALDQGRVRVLALATSGSVEEWEEKRLHHDPRWIPGRNVRDFEGIELYDFRAMPTFYLLSGNGIVLIKDQPLPVVERYLRGVI